MKSFLTNARRSYRPERASRTSKYHCQTRPHSHILWHGEIGRTESITSKESINFPLPRLSVLSVFDCRCATRTKLLNPLVAVFSWFHLFSDQSISDVLKLFLKNLFEVGSHEPHYPLQEWKTKTEKLLRFELGASMYCDQNIIEISRTLILKKWPACTRSWQIRIDFQSFNIHEFQEQISHRLRRYHSN